MKNPTLKEKITQYEKLFHQINYYNICGDDKQIRQLVWNIDNWSYAHRAGNGMLSEKEQQTQINNAFYKLLDVDLTKK